MCFKLVKKLHSIDALPINHTIFVAMAAQDHINAVETSTPPMVADSHKFLYSEFIRTTGMNAAKVEAPEEDKSSGMRFCVFHQDRI